MLFRLILVFITLPLLELAILIKLGQVIGVVATISLVIITGILGATLARYQGFIVLGQIQSEMHAGRVPGAQLVEGLLILIAAIVLLTPGLLTDLLGFLLLIPAFRRRVKAWLRRRFENMLSTGQGGVFIYSGRTGGGPNDFNS